MSLTTTLLLNHGIGMKTSSAQSIIYRQVFLSTAEVRESSDPETPMHDIFISVSNLWCDFSCAALPLFAPSLIKTERTALFPNSAFSAFQSGR